MRVQHERTKDKRKKKNQYEKKENALTACAVRIRDEIKKAELGLEKIQKCREKKRANNRDRVRT